MDKQEQKKRARGRIEAEAFAEVVCYCVANAIDAARNRDIVGPTQTGILCLAFLGVAEAFREDAWPALNEEQRRELTRILASKDLLLMGINQEEGKENGN